ITAETIVAMTVGTTRAEMTRFEGRIGLATVFAFTIVLLSKDGSSASASVPMSVISDVPAIGVIASPPSVFSVASPRSYTAMWSSEAKASSWIATSPILHRFPAVASEAGIARSRRWQSKVTADEVALAAASKSQNGDSEQFLEYEIAHCPRFVIYWHTVST